MKNLLMVFAKSPIKGEVKTRLGNEIGFEKSHWVYLQLLKKKSVINLNYTYIVFGKNKAYKEKYETLLVSMSKSFKKFN